MRIDFNSLISSISPSSYLSRPQPAAEAAPAAPMRGEDSVQISKEAREAYQAYAFGKVEEDDERNTKEEFQQYMQTCRESPKTAEDKFKELQEKLKDLQTELSEVMADEAQTESAKEAKIVTLDAQINQVVKEISDLAGEL